MSTPHEVLYNDAVGAMRASLSPLTSKEQRVLVELFLSQLKEDQRCLEIMVHLLTSQSEYHDDFIRMLSLTILNDWLKIWWNKISDQERSSLRNTVVMLVKGSVGKSPVKGLWTKLAVMISNIAVRQFPQQWPTFLNDMASLCAPGAADSSRFGEKEIALMSIEYLASDSIDTDYCSSLPLERRQDILAGFRENLPQLLSFAFSLMVDCSKVCGDLPPKGERRGQERGEMSSYVALTNSHADNEAFCSFGIQYEAHIRINLLFCCVSAIAIIAQR